MRTLDHSAGAAGLFEMLRAEGVMQIKAWAEAIAQISTHRSGDGTVDCS